jgi:hypothetical protein
MNGAQIVFDPLLPWLVVPLAILSRWRFLVTHLPSGAG